MPEEVFDLKRKQHPGGPNKPLPLHYDPDLHYLLKCSKPGACDPPHTNFLTCGWGTGVFTRKKAWSQEDGAYVNNPKKRHKCNRHTSEKG